MQYYATALYKFASDDEQNGLDNWGDKKVEEPRVQKRCYWERVLRAQLKAYNEKW